MLGCAVRQLERGLLAQARPHPGADVGWQAVGPALAHLGGGGVGVVGGALDEGECGQFGRLAIACGALARKVTLRVVAEFVDGAGHVCAEQGGRLACHARAAGLDRHARLAPDVGRRQSLGVEQGRGEQRAAFVGVALCEPGAARFGGDVLAVLVAHQQPIAAHFAVVGQLEARLFGAKVGPVAAVAEFEQPVVAQAVFEVAARPAGVEGVELVLACFAQAVVQFPVVGPHRQRVLGRKRGGARGGQPRTVALAQGFARFKNRVGGGLRAGGRWHGPSGQDSQGDHERARQTPSHGRVERKTKRHAVGSREPAEFNAAERPAARHGHRGRAPRCIRPTDGVLRRLGQEAFNLPR